MISCIPILVLITGALITKKIGESMIVASVVGVVLVYKSNFFNGYVEQMYHVLTNNSYQFILIIIMCFGAAVKLFQVSGCLTGFGNLVSKVASNVNLVKTITPYAAAGGVITAVGYLILGCL